MRKSSKNNIIGVIVYLLVSVLFGPEIALLMLFIKENSDRCHYYSGRWSKLDLLLGISSISVGIIINNLIDSSLKNIIL